MISGHLSAHSRPTDRAPLGVLTNDEIYRLYARVSAQE